MLLQQYPGAQIQVFNYAVSTENGEHVFFLDSRKNQVGASLIGNKKHSLTSRQVISEHAVNHTVHTIDVMELLQSIHAKSPKPAAVMIKMDIEGSEYQILPSLITRGGCRLLDALAVEWHARMLPRHPIHAPAEMKMWAQRENATAPGIHSNAFAWERWLQRTLPSRACGVILYEGNLHT